jgi:hypothetical protein
MNEAFFCAAGSDPVFPEETFLISVKESLSSSFR